MSATGRSSPTVAELAMSEDKRGSDLQDGSDGHVLEEDKGVQRALSGGGSHSGAVPAFESMRTNLWVVPIPKWRRYDPSKPVVLGLPLNLLLAIGATIVVANLYWCQPILVQLSQHFGVDYNAISSLPSLVQGGYAAGLLLISPLGDLVRRRSLALILLLGSTTLTIGLALTRSLAVFQALSFLIAMLSVTPQIFIPLTADLAPDHRRSTAISITMSGLLLGLLVARVLSGTITNYVNYQAVYWLAFGLQCALFLLLWLFMPDFPAKTNVSYGHMLWSMVTYLKKYPILIQCCTLGFFSSCVFSSWWNVNAFLLTDTYGYNPFQIGLFGLVGIGGVLTAPLCGRLLDMLVPWWGQLFAMGIQIAFIAIATAAAKRNVAVVIVAAWGLDLGLQLGQVSNSTRIYGLDPAARSRLNAIFIIVLFLGQLVGAAAGTHAYTAHGWEASSGLSLGLLCFNIIVLLMRGPHASGWFGWDGGWAWRKEKPQAAKDVEAQQPNSKTSEAEPNADGKATDAAAGEVPHRASKKA